MARTLVARELAARGGRPVWREGFVTDNGNHILDIHGLTITDPVALERELNQIAGHRHRGPVRAAPGRRAARRHRPGGRDALIRAVRAAFYPFAARLHPICRVQRNRH